jgi:hypothetical protein
MARGFESKSVESQQSDGLQGRSRQDGEEQSRAELEQRRRRESVELSRRRVLSELQKARSEVHRSALQNALRHLDEELRKLGG